MIIIFFPAAATGASDPAAAMDGRRVGSRLPTELYGGCLQYPSETV
jgi:hypothetical protein